LERGRDSAACAGCGGAGAGERDDSAGRRSYQCDRGCAWRDDGRWWIWWGWRWARWTWWRGRWWVWEWGVSELQSVAAARKHLLPDEQWGAGFGAVVADVATADEAVVVYERVWCDVCRVAVYSGADEAESEAVRVHQFDGAKESECVF